MISYEARNDNPLQSSCLRNSMDTAVGHDLVTKQQHKKLERR